MKQTHTRRDKGRAMFLAALMVLSVFAMSVSFAGAAAAQTAETDLNNEVVWSGQTIEVISLNGDEPVQLRQGDSESSSPVEQLSTNASGEVTIDTEGLEAGTYFLRGASATGSEFEVVEQTLDASFEDDSIDADGSTDLNIDSNRATYDVEVTSDDFDGNELGNMLSVPDDAADTGATDDVYVDGDAVEDAESNHNVNFNGVEAGKYNFTVTVTETGVEDTATISVAEEVEGNAFFDDSVYSAEAGDVVEFTVEMEDVDSTVVRIEDDEGNYWTDLHVTADGEDEVTVSFNTYEAGQDDSQADNAAFSAENGSVEVLDQRDFTEENSNNAEYRLLPSDLNLELYLANQEDVDGIVAEAEESEEDDVRLDLSDLNEVDVATLVLNERSTGDISTAVAPAGDDIEDVEDINDVGTTGSAVAEDDQLIVGVDVSGVFGYLDALPEDEDLGDYLNLTIEQSNPEQYDSPNSIDEFEVIEDSENNRLYFVIDTNDANIEAGQEYDVTFTADGTDFLEYYNDNDDNEKASTDFTSSSERSRSLATSMTRSD